MPGASPARRIAIVVQRYGTEVTGGAEQLARLVAQQLARRHDVTIVTTCALDHRTWRDHFPPGESNDGGVRVLRFRVDRERAPDFDRWVPDFYRSAPHTPAAEEDFLQRQGPVSSALLSYLSEHGSSFDAIIFYTYLYSPTVHGLPRVADRSILVPTAHDEPAIYLGIYRHVFQAARAFVFLSREERALVHRIFPNASPAETIAPIGLETGVAADAGRFRQRYRVEGDYVLYVGRVEPSKGVAALIEVVRAARRSVLPGLQLVLLGGHGMPVPTEDWIIAPGFVDEQTKRDAIAGCLALISPSIHESLGISVLEAWAQGRPVVADARADVVLDHCRSSQAGLWYSTPEELAAELRWLREHPSDAAALGRNGQRFVNANYAWPEVIRRYERIIDSVRATAHA